jgi:hypothetical protein
VSKVSLILGKYIKIAFQAKALPIDGKIREDHNIYGYNISGYIRVYAGIL